MNMIDSLLAPLALDFNDAGVASVAVPAIGVVLHVEKMEDTQQVRVYTELGLLPVQERAEVLEALLQANISPAQTGGGVLALHPETGMVLLSRTWDVAYTETESLLEALDGLIDSALHWKECLTTSLWKPQATTATSLPETPPALAAAGMIAPNFA